MAATGSVLVLMTAMGPLVQYSVPALAPFLVQEFAVSRTEIGLFGSLLFGSSAVLSPLMGRLTDLGHDRRLAITMFAAALTAPLIMAAAPAYAVILLGGMLAAVSMATAHPLTNRMLLLLPGGRTRGFLVAVKHSGVKLAQGCAGFLLAPVAVLAGWRAALALPAALGAVGLLVVPRLVHSTGPTSATSRSSGQVPPMLWWISAYAVLMGLSQSAVGAYVGLYAYEVLETSAATAGIITGTVGVAGFLARIVWGGAGANVSSAARPLLGIAGASVPGTALILLSATNGLPVLFAAAVVLGITFSLWNVATTLIVFRFVPAAFTGRSTSRIYVGFSVGMMAGPVLFGLIVDQGGRWATGWLSLLVWQCCALLVTIPLRRRGEERPA